MKIARQQSFCDDQSTRCRDACDSDWDSARKDNSVGQGTVDTEAGLDKQEAVQDTLDSSAQDFQAQASCCESGTADILSLVADFRGSTKDKVDIRC